MNERSRDDDGESSLPRIVGTWPRAYALVLGALAVEVVLFWLLGWMFGGGPA
jgi:hypothetical protein